MLASKGDLVQHKGVCFLTVLWLSFNGFSCVRIILSKILACQLTKNISWKPRSSTLRIQKIQKWNMCSINRFMIGNNTVWFLFSQLHITNGICFLSYQCGFVAFFVLQRCNDKNAPFLWPQILFKREKTK